MANTERLARKTQEVVVLARVAELLTSLDLNNVLVNTLHLLTDVVGATRGSFWLLDEEGQATEQIITRRSLPPERSSQVVEKVLESGLAGWVYRHKRGAVIKDTLTDERWVKFSDDSLSPRSAMCVPFVFDGRVHGIMTLEHTEPNVFNPDDLMLATTVANQATIALRNARLFDQVETQERQLFAVLQSTAEPLLTISPQRQVQMINAAALRMLGATEQDVIGQRLEEIAVFNPIFAQVAERIQAGAEWFELRDDLTGIDYAVRSSAWRDGETRELGRVIVFNDITSLKDLSRLKSQMIQIASHDLKNPLGVVLGYAEMLLLEIQPEDDKRVYAEGIARVTERMLNMVMELLDLERVESGQGARQSFSPLAVIDAVLSEEMPKAVQKGQSVLRQVVPNLPDLLGESAMIREAFRNLIDNAIKYTPDGGLIIVRANADERRFHFSVEDTGYGVPQELQTNLFQRFYRAKQPGAEDIPGTGLGLSLVKAVVERHGGEVWFRSAPKEGSTFGFWLPLPEDV